MKRACFAIVLMAFELLQAGPIADLYWRQNRTNRLESSGAFSAPKPVSTAHGITEIGIERTPCFGSCPVFSFIIRSDGTVLYHGGANAERFGDWETKIDCYRFHQLANFIVDSGYAEMPDSFASNVTDGDTVYTMFTLQGRRKVFSNYASSGPPKLWALQQLTEGLLVGATWHPKSSPTNAATGKTLSPAQTNRPITPTTPRR